MSATLAHPLPTYTRERLEARINERVISEQLAPMLAGDVELDSSSLVGNAWSRVGKLLALGPSEERFLANLQEGKLSTELLFQGDLEEARRIAGHPAIQWKVENVRGHIARSAKKRKESLPLKRHY